MIILDERQFLASEFLAKGFDVFDFYENTQILSMKEFNSLELKRRAEILIVDTETVLKHPDLQENFKSLMNTFLGAVFFHDHSNEKAQEWVKNEGAFLNKIIGEYSLPMPQLSWTILSNQLQFCWNLIEDQRKLQRHMIHFSQELDLVLQEAEVEMTKAKKLQFMLVPKRNVDIKGVHFLNKYAVGDGGGGEVYDFHQTATKVYQILISSDSYLVSSALSGILSQHRLANFNPASFMKDAFEEIETINQSKKNKAKVDISLLELDTGTLILKCYSESKSELYSQMSGRISLSPESSYQLGKGEKVIVFSCGFLFNWSVGHPQKEMHNFLKDNSNLSVSELMSELFFQLQEGKESQFLKKDATVMMMEVKRHGIHKI